MQTEIVVALIAASAAVTTSIFALYQSRQSNQIIQDSQRSLQNLQNHFTKQLEILKADLIVNQHKRLAGASIFTEERRLKINAIKEAIESLQEVKDSIINTALKSIPQSLSQDSFSHLIKSALEKHSFFYTKNLAHFSKEQQSIIHNAKKETERLARILSSPDCYINKYFVLSDTTQAELLNVKNEFTEIQNILRDMRDVLITVIYEEDIVG